MLFNSIEFAIFFPVVTALYYLLPQRWKSWMLLLASCVFYMAFIPAYILILLVTILIDYCGGIYIEKSLGKTRRYWLVASILSTCLVLFVFKYINFANHNLAALARFLDWNYPIGVLAIILPIGLSFHTFQSLSYVIEVYRGRQKPEKRFGIYALYVMFYPQLVAGPIERPQNLLHQFDESHRFDYNQVTSGLRLMTWGLFKKMVIADRLARYVNPVYAAPQEFSALQLIVATFFFAYQIYCDFSGYSDIAIGAARVMGFKLMTNFDRPYSSKSIGEFWKRWHISLSTWFKDYLYISLGGNRVAKWRWYLNLAITFIVSGLWHGANWTYILWGALNGFYLIIGLTTKRLRDRLRGIMRIDEQTWPVKVLQTCITFALVCVGWILFRARNLDDALFVFTHLFSGLRIGSVSAGVPGFGRFDLVVALVGIIALEIIQAVRQRYSMGGLLASIPFFLRWPVYYAAFFIILFFGIYSQTQFIYFQF
jgi:D-alanyl-lipoteichoic acid acyltransferase DltB (MBOAT superfamily)